MKSLTIAISLRVLIIITFSLYAFSSLYTSSSFYYDSPTPLSSSRLYFMLSFSIVIGLIHLQWYKHIKNSPDGRFIIKEMILPEFNSNDEREAEITGKAAKDALSTILIFTPIAIATMALALNFEGEFPLMFTLLIASSIPIAGLIAYYFSYRYHYLQ